MIRKKILIAGGCSYTDANYLTNDKTLPQVRGAWKMWPEHMGNALGLKTINVGYSGSSNETIYHKVLEQIYLYKDRIDTVAVMWSGMDRQRIFAGYDLNPLSEAVIELGTDPAYKNGATPFNWMDAIGMPKLSYRFFSSKDFYKARPAFIKYSLEDSLRAYHSLADICEKYGIKFIFMSGLFPFDYHQLNSLEEKGLTQAPDGHSVTTYESDLFKEYMNNIWFSSFEKNYKEHFIGWPIFTQLGGTYFDELRHQKRHPFDKHESYKVSETDLHPNAEAQEIVAQMFLERHRKIYG